MSPEDVRSFFRDSDVLEITAVIRDAPDEDLRRLLDLDHFRAQGVVAILDRFPEFADAGRLQEIDGVARFDLARGKKVSERHTARFGGGSVTLEPDATPDVTICAEIVDFVRLVTG